MKIEIESRQFVQSILDAVTPHVFGGADVMITLAAVAACPDGFPKVLVGIASACLEGERAKLMFRSGRCLPMGKHAGQKERAQAEAVKAIEKAPPKKQGRRNGMGKRVANTIAEAGKEGMNTRQLAHALKIDTKQVASAVKNLYAASKIVRKPITHPEQYGPQFTYFAPKAVELAS
jgi:hypothetical protein